MAKPYKQNLFCYLEGLGQLPENAIFRVELEGDYLVLMHVNLHVLKKDDVVQRYQIKASDILDFGIIKQSELKKQSVIGRGMVGGFLFGPVGAMLGGMSATAKQKIKSVFAVSYLPSQGDEPKTLMFDADQAGWGASNALWASKTRAALSKIPKSSRVLAYLGQTTNADGSITL